MAEYKDVEPLKKQIADFKRAVKSENSDYLTGYISALSAVEGMTAGQPAADVEPVKHGHFRRLTFSGDTIICSECKMAYNIFETNGAENFNFCPHCGAKMDGGEGE